MGNEVYPLGYNEGVQVLVYQSRSGRSPVEEWIAGLPEEDQARFADVKDGIKRYGLACPRVTFRQLEGKLWEIKFSAPSGGYRVAYVLLERGRMIWLHVFRKTSRRTPRDDLDVARRRMKEVLAS